MPLIPLKDIRIDGGTQSRAEIHQATVAEYAEVADHLPPGVAFFDGASYWLSDGFHRYWARKQAGLADMDLDVRAGTQRDAILFSVGANDAHGLRRTPEDKRKAVGILLDDEEWSGKSDRWVAEQAKVSNHFVAKCREEWTPSNGQNEQQDSTGNDPSSNADPKRTGKDGKNRPAGSSARAHSGPNDSEQDAKPEEEPADHRRVREHFLLRPEDSNRTVAKALQISEHVVAKVRRKMALDGTFPQPSQDNDEPAPPPTAPKRKKKQQNGRVVYDWKTFDAPFGKIRRAMDQVANAHEGEKKSREFTQGLDLLGRFLAVWNSWKKRLTKVEA